MVILFNVVIMQTGSSYVETGDCLCGRVSALVVVARYCALVSA